MGLPSAAHTAAVRDALQKAKWQTLGHFAAEDEYGAQEFVIPNPDFAKFLKVMVVSHHGSEFYCTLSEVRVYGATIVESMKGDMEDVGKVRNEHAAAGLCACVPCWLVVIGAPLRGCGNAAGHQGDARQARAVAHVAVARAGYGPTRRRA